jgi:Domain of unknown function (DUF4332)
MRIEDVEGIAEVSAGQLRAAGIATTEDLLDRGASPAGRATLESATGISGKP